MSKRAIKREIHAHLMQRDHHVRMIEHYDAVLADNVEGALRVPLLAHRLIHEIARDIEQATAEDLARQSDPNGLKLTYAGLWLREPPWRAKPATPSEREGGGE